MAEQDTVLLQPRTTLGKAVRRLRRDGIIPANIYGRSRDSRAVQLDAKEAQRLLASHRGASVLRLRVDDAEEAAVIRHVKHEPKSGRIQHIDFMHVDLSVTMRARVPVRLVGEAPAVRIHGGTVLHLVDAVEVECLPADLPPALELDISHLEALDSVLYAGNLTLPLGVQLLTSPDEVLVKIAAPRVEEGVAPTPIEETPAAVPEPAAAEQPED
jgi:large subunit ribosomal protein L25